MDHVLEPVSPPVGFLPQYIRKEPTTLVLKEKVLSWSGSDFGIKDLDGNVIARCKGKFPSLHGKKVITDPEGSPLYHLRKELMVLHKTFIAENDSGKEVFRIRKEIFSWKSKMLATFTNIDQTNSSISLRGSFWGYSATLHLGSEGKGPAIAEIHRHIWNRRELASKQTYYVTIAPGVDIALVAGICICFDQAQDDSRRGAAGGGGGGVGGG